MSAFLALDRLFEESAAAMRASAASTAERIRDFETCIELDPEFH